MRCLCQLRSTNRTGSKDQGYRESKVYTQMLMLEHEAALRKLPLMPCECMQDGAGWCAYDDIMLGARKLREATGGQIQKFLYIDLDVHQVTHLL